MQDLKRISIISTVYNKENFLNAHIKSLLHQDYKNIEFIFVNDGSTDNSLEILKKYVKKDSRIKLINQKNEGPSYARKRGFIESTGEYVYFVDADDTLYNSSSISSIMKILNSNIDVDLFLSKMINSYDNRDSIDDVIYDAKVVEGKYNSEFIYDKLFRLSLCYKIFNRKLIKDSDFINKRIYEDGVLSYIAISRSKKFYYSKVPLYVVNRKRSNSNSITTIATIEKYNDKYNSIKYLYKYNMFNVSLNKLYTKTYLDDLYSSLDLKYKEKKELLKFINRIYDKSIINKTYLLNNSHYKLIYYFRYFYKNIIFNLLISFLKNIIYLLKKIYNYIKTIYNKRKNLN